MKQKFKGKNSFSNVLLDPESIPQMEHVAFDKLKPSYRWVHFTKRLVSLIAIWLLYFMIVFVFGLWEPIYLLWGPLILMTLSFIYIYIAYIAYDYKSYALREHDILYKSGIFWKTEFAVPYERIQHSEVKRGPIDELFEVAKLKIFTAGGANSDLTIPGLDPGIADKLRAVVFEQNSSGRAEEE